MRKKHSLIPNFSIEVDYVDGYADSITDTAPNCRVRFANIVQNILTTHSDIKEVRLVDNANRIYKSFTQHY